MICTKLRRISTSLNKRLHNNPVKWFHSIAKSEFVAIKRFKTALMLRPVVAALSQNGSLHRDFNPCDIKLMEHCFTCNKMLPWKPLATGSARLITPYSCATVQKKDSLKSSWHYCPYDCILKVADSQFELIKIYSS